MASKRISGITIEIGGDTTRLSESLKKVDGSLRTTQASLKDVNSLLKLDPKNTELLRQKQELLSSAIQDTKGRLEKLKTASEQAAKTAGNYDAWKAAYTPLKEEIDSTSKKLTELKEHQKELESAGRVDTDEYRALQTEIGTTSDRLKELKAQAKAVSDEFGNPVSPEQYNALQREIAATEQNLTKLETESRGAGKAAEDLGGKGKEADAKLNALGEAAKTAGEKASHMAESVAKATAAAAKAAAVATAAATTALGAFVKSSVDVGKGFDSAMSQVAATMGLTAGDIQNNVNGAGDTFDLLKDKALEMGSSTNYTAKQAAEGLNILAMSGYDAEKSVGMIEDVLHLAAAGGMDLASAAGYVSGAMKGFADETKSAQFYADLMAKGATLANTSVAELGDAMASGAAGAASYHQSAESMTLALLRLAEQGDVGAAAGTALSAVMKNLYTPTDQARKALDELGVSAYQNGRALDINDIVNNLSSALAEYSEEEANAYKQTIFGIQGLDAFNKMVVTGTDTQGKWAAALADASDGMGEAAKQYATMTDNLEGDLAALGSAFEGLQIAVHERVEPAFRQFAQFGTESLQQVTAAFREGGLDGAMEALGPVIENGIAMALEQVPTSVKAGAGLVGAIVDGVAGNIDTLTRGLLDIDTFHKKLAELEERGMAAGVVETIRSMGVSAEDELDALLNLSDKKLSQYAELYERKEQLASDIALRELGEFQETESAEIQSQMESLQALYEENGTLLGESFTDSLASAIRNGLTEVLRASEEMAKTAAGKAAAVLSGFRGAALPDLSGLQTAVDRAGSATAAMASGLSAPPAQPVPAYAGGYGASPGGTAVSGGGEPSGGRTYNLAFYGQVGGRTVARAQSTYAEEEAAREGESLIRLR